MLQGLLGHAGSERPTDPAASRAATAEARGGGDQTSHVSTPRTTAAAPPDATPTPEAERASGYGQGRAVLVARDPQSLFAHWEIPPVRRVEALRSLGAEGEHTREILRVFETARIPPAFRDIELAPGADRTNIPVEHAGRAYRVEVGLRTASARFVPLAMSNLVSTPAAQPSDDTSVRWVALDANGAPREVTVAWDGRRVTTPQYATALDTPAPAAADRTGSSEALPSGPRASDALPIR